jgi:GH25 family lysozyme M1 (1,4-beta-N-acetylmuramidase)
MNPLIADASRYNYPIYYKGLKQAGFEALIAKSGAPFYEDPMLLTHAAGTHAAGMYLGIYYWVDGLHDGNTQARHCISQAEKVGADFIAGDIEQWWADWGKWLAALQGHLPWSEVPRLQSKQIDRVSHDFMNYLKANQERPLLNYTSTGFVSTYCREMNNWINEYSKWLAQYPKTGDPPDLKRHFVTFDVLKEHYLPTTLPVIPKNWNAPDAWQWTGDRFTFPGIPGALDISFWMNKTQTLAQWVKRDPPPVHDDPWIVMKLTKGTTGLNIRSGPGIQYSILGVKVPTSQILKDPVPGLIEWTKLYGEPGYVKSFYIEPAVPEPG